jgi:uroporphyrinogen III methyltransferase/synthase
LLNRLWDTGRDLRKLGNAKLAAIGEGTAEALARYHLHADLVPESYRAEALAEALRSHVTGKRVLWARASRGRDVLALQLRSAGAVVEEVVVYRNLDVKSLDAEVVREIEAGAVDWVCLSSPSIARAFHRLLTPAARDQLGKKVCVASISPVTSAAARELRMPVDAEAKTYTWDGLLAAIVPKARILGSFGIGEANTS